MFNSMKGRSDWKLACAVLAFYFCGFQGDRRIYDAVLYHGIEKDLREVSITYIFIGKVNITESFTHFLYT